MGKGIIINLVAALYLISGCSEPVYFKSKNSNFNNLPSKRTYGVNKGSELNKESSFTKSYVQLKSNFAAGANPNNPNNWILLSEQAIIDSDYYLERALAKKGSLDKEYLEKILILRKQAEFYDSLAKAALIKSDK